MRMSATIDFWGDGVDCFCHEAVVRALQDAFDDILIDTLDRAHQKYRNVADQSGLEESAWFEFLRNGPRFEFQLLNGVTGVFSRYEVTFQLPETIADIDFAKIRSFLNGLRHREIAIEEEA
jgi:hypothetical protein